jgi:hypothetical protein
MDLSKSMAFSNTRQTLLEGRPGRGHPDINFSLVRSISVVNTGASSEVVSIFFKASDTAYKVMDMLIPPSQTAKFTPEGISLTQSDGTVSIVGMSQASSSGGGSGGVLDHVSLPISVVAGQPYQYVATGPIVEYMILGASGRDLSANVEISGNQLEINADVSFSGTLHVIHR